ncbi:Metallo-dependent phosphatase [Jimgerdemannia flammicorona]|uniref:Serine/threonine-protein phosphatase n=1 Tax=Jimgerdemannia flammicorona TaxID=994334 RepID=A0A433D9N4_9FUNG|nr:Metallo-dependent phosphatase [Jimgerdemannia flammicorona]
MGLDLDACIETLYQKQLLAESLLREICEKTKELLMRESNVVHIKAPVTVVGDIHGRTDGHVVKGQLFFQEKKDTLLTNTLPASLYRQYYDLIEIFQIGGYCPSTNYLFLGKWTETSQTRAPERDYVDRGLSSVETISLLTCLKLRYPDRVQLVRGNHESRAVTQTYGFYTECMRKYGSAQVWQYFTDMFDFLTLSVVIDNSIFCVHGDQDFGPVPSKILMSRFSIEIPHEGAMADLVWSDPDPDKEDFAVSPRYVATLGAYIIVSFPMYSTIDAQIGILPDTSSFRRGAGYTFGSQVVKKFLEVNGMQHILRAHQLCMEGYQVLYEDRLSTVWSAPNYCYRCGNMASILEVGAHSERFFNVFDAAPVNERTIANGAGANGMAQGAVKTVPTHFVKPLGDT